MKNVGEKHRYLVLSRRRAGTEQIIGRAPLRQAASVDLLALAGGAEIRSGDVLEVSIDPPFHTVSAAPPRRMVAT